MTVHERFIDTSHGRLAVAETDGKGPAVLLIHGNSSCKEAFVHQLKGPVGEAYRLIAYDLPGHGASADAPRPERTYSMDGYADLAVELLGLLGVDQAAVVGWSLGGHIGIEMTLRFPGLKGLLITGTPPVGKADDAIAQGFKPSEEIKLAGQEIYGEGDAEAFCRTTVNAKGTLDPHLLAMVRRTDGRARRLMFESFLAGRGADQLQVVQTSQVPLAIVSGADEHFVNNDYLGKPRYANLWEGVVFIVPGVGHAPFLEAPAVFDPILLRFLQAIR